METYNNDPAVQPKRSFLLWFLAICTMVSAGSSIITFLVYMLFPQILQQSMEVMQGMSMFQNEQYQQVFDLYLSIKGWQYGLLILCEAAIFAGALIMLWKLKPVGFHLYVIGQIALFCVQNFVVGGLMRSTWNTILWTVLIVVLYYLQIWQRHPASVTSDEDDIQEYDENEDDD